ARRPRPPPAERGGGVPGARPGDDGGPHPPVHVGGPAGVVPAGGGGKGMSWIALKMLVGDTAKYVGILFGVSFAALLMTQQGSIFTGLMRNTTSQIRDIEGAD